VPGEWAGRSLKSREEIPSDLNTMPLRQRQNKGQNSSKATAKPAGGEDRQRHNTLEPGCGISLFL